MYTKIQDVTLDSLQKQCTMIHYFGLGFIQIKLGKQHRIHFYTELLPPIIDEEEVHNHRYDFTSKILYGELNQEIFSVAPGDTHLLVDESCTEGLVPQEEKSTLCTIQKTESHHFVRGSEYFIDHNVFHRIKAKNAVTFLTRTDYKKQYAQVIREKDAPKVCPFSEKISEEKLWGIVESILKNIAQQNR